MNEEYAWKEDTKSRKTDREEEGMANIEKGGS